MKPATDLMKRFWDQVSIPPEGCWTFLGAHTQFGHGTIGLGGRGGKTVYAHRLIWEQMNGPIADGLQVLHHCDNPACVRIDHLFLGTQKDNIHDMDSKGRRVRVAVHGKDSPNAKLTADDVTVMRHRHRSGLWTCTELAREFGVSLTTAHRAVTARSWAHL